ncbi:MAG TPA: response regulator transcription factor [Acidimicrobiales bacterium]|nr:response regulator transcription factor [Acidimicrobiales bacterium]
MDVTTAHDEQGAPGRRPVVRVFLLDDHEVVRLGLRELIGAEEDLAVVGEASCVADARARLASCRPDVAVLDVRLSDGDGIDVCREIRTTMPEVACLVLTSFSDDDALVAAVLAGASGYLLRQVRGTELVSAIRRASRGESLLDPDLVARAHEHVGEDRDYERLDRLSRQERRILALLARGMTNREISVELVLAEKTVKNYVSSVLDKLGMSRRTEAAVFAVRAEQHDQRPSVGGT